MAVNGDITALCLRLLKEAGASEAQCVLTETNKYDISALAGKMSLFRTVRNIELRMLAISGHRQGVVVVNSLSKDVLMQAARRAVTAAEASPRDAAYSVSEFQPKESFERGDQAPDPTRMHFRLSEFIRETGRYPKLKLSWAGVDFVLEKKVFANSNGVRFSSSVGMYDFYVDFSSQAAGKSSSINFTYVSLKDLEKPLLKCGSISLLLKQSGQSIGVKPIGAKFVGDIIVSPECLDGFLQFITDQALRDSMVVSGTSVYRGKIGRKVAKKEFTLRSSPLDSAIPSGYFITSDGYKAGDLPIIEKGLLKSFILSRYGAAKTGLPRAASSGGCYVIEGGTKSYAEMVRGVKRGLLVTRFSSGGPNGAGDFSGVAKNSFYIEDGEIKFPVSETMISGNIPAMLLSINGISKERINSGHSIYPWIVFSGITVSGK